MFVIIVAILRACSTCICGIYHTPSAGSLTPHVLGTPHLNWQVRGAIVCTRLTPKPPLRALLAAPPLALFGARSRVQAHHPEHRLYRTRARYILSACVLLSATCKHPTITPARLPERGLSPSASVVCARASRSHLQLKTAADSSSRLPATTADALTPSTLRHPHSLSLSSPP